MSHGPYTVTRPLITQTITECTKCTSTAPAVPPASTPLASTPLVPSGAGATTPGTPAPTQTPYNAASRAATGAGAGLAAVFGAAALLL